MATPELPSERVLNGRSEGAGRAWQALAVSRQAPATESFQNCSLHVRISGTDRRAQGLLPGRKTTSIDVMGDNLITP